MCLMMYIGSEKKLEIIVYSENNPGFYVKPLNADEKEHETIQQILGLEHIYFAGSYMGCSCGLYFYGKANENKDDDIGLRVRDLMDMKQYLANHLPGNELKLFLTWWDEFDYIRKTFSLSCINAEEYVLEQDIVYTQGINKKH